MKRKLVSLFLVLAILGTLTVCAVIPNGTTIVAGNTDDQPVPSGATYTNGMYMQGAQVRVADDENVMGLRFITVISTQMLSDLEEAGATNIQYGTLVSLTNSTPTLETDTKVKAKNIFRTQDQTGGDYQKFTAVVTGIPQKQYETDIYVRPYLIYTTSEEGKVVLYGTTYSADLYQIAKAAYNSSSETASTKQYLLNNILYKVYPDFPDESKYTDGIYKP